ncbi:MAG: hypothetical protein IJE06_05140 [Alistipes sp.]|nr:hypothetical protein [Alistipes sp.]
MKKFYASFKSVVAAVVLASMTLAASCSYDDTGVKNELEQIKVDLAALTERVAALEKRLAEEVDALTDLIEGKVVVTEITKDAEGNTIINLSNGEKVTVLAGCDCVPTEPCDCDPLQYRVVDGVLEVSADGENWIAVKVAPECVVAEVVVNEDNTVTITLANGEEFTVVKAEVIEFDSTRSQLYVLPGETKAIPFTINDAVADVNVMNQPLGWKAEVALAESEESEDNVDPGMGVLAAGGTEFVLSITGPAQEFVNAGFAEKEGYISVHFNSENGSCKVGKILVNLAEVKLNVDNAGNITLENTVAYEQTNYFGEKFVDFADFNIGVIPAEVYAQYGDKSFSDNFDDWMWEYTVNVASTKRSTGFGNVVDLQQYQEGSVEKEVYNFSVETLAGAFWPTYTFEYGKEYIIFVSLESEMVNYMEHPVLKGAVMANYKKTLVEAEYVADSATWNDASYTLSLAGYQYYVIGWYSEADLNQYIEQGVADSVEALVPMLIQNYGLTSAGAVVSGDFLDQTVTLSSLAESSMTGWAPGVDPGTKYYFFIYPFDAATEMELYTHQVVAENVYLFDTFETAALTEGTFDPGITYEVVTMNENSLNVSAFFGEEVVAYYYAYYSSPAEVPADRALEIMEYEMMYDFSWSTYCEAYQYKPTYPAYLCIVAINAAGEYVYAEQEFAPVPAPEVAITSFEYLGQYWDIADSDDSTTGGEYVYLVKTEDGNEFQINIYYAYCNADGSIIEGTYDYCTNMPDYMHSSWAGFAIISDSYYYDSKLVVAADKITLKLVGGENGPVDYVYVPGEGGEEPAAGFTPVRAELDLYFDGYEYNGNDSEYAFWLYDAEGAVFEVVYHYCQNNDWSDEWTTKFTKADGTVVEGYTSIQTQQPNDYNCEAGEKYYVVIATLSDGTEINIQAQLPTTEVNYLGEGAVNPGVNLDVIVLTSADIYNPSGFGDFYVNLYGADLEFVLNFYNCAGAEENFIKAGTYQVSTGNGVVYPGSYSKIWFGEGDDDYYVIDSGSVTVSEVDGQYKFDINVGTSDGLTFVATYTGAVEGLVVPSAYVEPEVGEPQELIIQKHSTSYTGTNEHEIQFWYDYDNYLMVTIDFEANPITAGTYTLEDGLIGQYCNSHNQKMKECTVVVTDNGDGTLTFDASFVVGYDAYYFTYTAQIYE